MYLLALPTFVLVTVVPSGKFTETLFASFVSSPLNVTSTTCHSFEFSVSFLSVTFKVDAFPFNVTLKSGLTVVVSSASMSVSSSPSENTSNASV